MKPSSTALPLNYASFPRQGRGDQQEFRDTYFQASDRGNRNLEPENYMQQENLNDMESRSKVIYPEIPLSNATAFQKLNPPSHFALSLDPRVNSTAGRDQYTYLDRQEGAMKPMHLSPTDMRIETPDLRYARTGNPNVFQCPHEGCGKVFQANKLLKKHMLTHRPKRFECHYKGCQKTFYERAKLKRHFIVHTGEKKFQCKECNKSFGYKANLKTHMRTHTGEKPYVCTVPGCNRRFAQASNRNAHVATHKKDKRPNNIKASINSPSQKASNMAYRNIVPANLSPPLARNPGEMFERYYHQIPSTSQSYAPYPYFQPTKVAINTDLVGHYPPSRDSKDEDLLNEDFATSSQQLGGSFPGFFEGEQDIGRY